jgi:hypothetical protein
MTAVAMLAADRDYWGIENGLHLRLDVTAGDNEPGDGVDEAVRQQAASDAARFLRCDVGRKRPESPLARNRLQTVLVTPMRNPR